MGGGGGGGWKGVGGSCMIRGGRLRSNRWRVGRGGGRSWGERGKEGCLMDERRHASLLKQLCKYNLFSVNS